MATNNIISRTDAQALVPERISNVLLNNLTAQSAALSLSQRIPMATNQTRMPVLAALPAAYFVNGDTGLKQTTEVNWANKYLNVEEIACIVPIPEAVLDDQMFDVWGAIRPLLEAAVARTLDAAILFGTNKPASWPTDITHAADTAGNKVTRGTATQAQGGVAQDFNNLFAAVEADGFVVDGVVSKTTMRAVLRGARDTTGQVLLDVANNSVMGQNVRWVTPGLWPAAATGSAEAIAGDWTNSIMGVRQDFTYKILDQAVIQNADGSIAFNLAQQDMVALRLVFRAAWQVANTINYEGTNDANQYPFAVLQHS